MSELRPHLHHAADGGLELGDREQGRFLLVLPARDALDQLVHLMERRRDAPRHPARALVEDDEEDRVEDDEAGDHPHADREHLLTDLARVGIDVLLRDDHEELPSRLGDHRPRGELASAELDGGDPGSAPQLLAEGREPRPLEQVERLRLEGVLQHGLVVRVGGELGETEVLLSRARNREQGPVLSEQHAVARPREREREHRLGDRPHRDVETDDALEEVASVHRSHGGRHPPVADGIDVHPGPHHPARRIVGGIGGVVEVVVRDVHLRRQLADRVEVGVEPVQ